MGTFTSGADKLLQAAAGGGGDGVVVIQRLITTSSTIEVFKGMQEITFIGVGGGGAGNNQYAGGGSGFFQKTFTDPVPGTQFKLTIAAATGTTYLRNSSDVIICQATGGTNATISPASHGTGGTASGGDINTKGAPGTAEGGGASGSPYGDSVGPDMFLIREVARAFVAAVKNKNLNNGGYSLVSRVRRSMTALGVRMVYPGLTAR